MPDLAHPVHSRVNCCPCAHSSPIYDIPVNSPHPDSSSPAFSAESPHKPASPAAPRIAFFGGSFDPPHLGHLAVARAARVALHLDTVLFAPVGAQPLKPQGSTAPFSDRLAMTRLAIAGEPAFAVSLLDAPSGNARPNYTLDTLRTLRAQLPPAGSLFCLMGADSFLSLRRWHGAGEIPFVASLVIASRPGQHLDDLAASLPDGLTLDPNRSVPSELAVLPIPSAPTPQSAPSHSPLPSAIELRTCLLHGSAGQTASFYLLPGLDVEISASAIRHQVRCCFDNPAATQNLLPPAVSDYIRTHALYR
jgi:nicotinate-nucleotide adenylyltransferase